jgi:hypothetical protein
MVIDAREAQVLERTRAQRLDEAFCRLERRHVSIRDTRDEALDFCCVHRGRPSP